MPLATPAAQARGARRCTHPHLTHPLAHSPTRPLLAHSSPTRPLLTTPHSSPLLTPRHPSLLATPHPPPCTPQREREEHEAFLAEYERRCKEQGYDAQAAADAVKTSRQVNVADELSRRSAAAEIRQDEWQYATEITRAQKEQRQAAQQKQLAALAKEQAAARTRRSMLGGTGAGAGTGAFGGSVASTSRPAPPAPADARSRSGTLASR